MDDAITPIEETPAAVEVQESVVPATEPVEPTAEPVGEPVAEGEISEAEISAAADAFLSQFGTTPAAEPAPAEPTPAASAPAVEPQVQPTSVAGQYVSRLDQLEARLKEGWDSYEHGAPATEVAILEFLKETQGVISSLESKLEGTQSAISPFVQQQQEAAANRLIQTTDQAVAEIKAAYPNAPVDTTSLLRMVGSKFDAFAQLTGLSGGLESIDPGTIKALFETSMRPHLATFAAAPKAGAVRPDAIASGSGPVVTGELSRDERIEQDLAQAGIR